MKLHGGNPSLNCAKQKQNENWLKPIVWHRKPGGNPNITCMTPIHVTGLITGAAAPGGVATIVGATAIVIMTGGIITTNPDERLTGTKSTTGPRTTDTGL